MTSDSEARQWIRVRGARTHNLRNINLDLPTGALIVMTGVSGSGKSSLAFDTLFAEGQRRYLESVSVQSRTLLRQWPKPDVDAIEGLAPTICVDQRTDTLPQRSTLAMLSGIHDYLRVLYARGGTAHCTNCKRPVHRQSIEQIVQAALELPERTRLMILSPVVRMRRGAQREVLERLVRNGFVRARIDGELIDLSGVSALAPGRTHSIDVVVDRLVVKEGIAGRLRESIDLACRESGGTCLLSHEAEGLWHERLLSTRFHCADCDISYPTPEPRDFSHNSPQGACPACTGLGSAGDRMCPACEGSRLRPLAAGVTIDGISLPKLLSHPVEAATEIVSRWLDKACDTRTADPEGGHTASAGAWPRALQLIAGRTLPDVLSRLRYMKETGIGYLTLDRSSRTLSGGESQRARLAAALASPSTGALYILDEPTCGLHPRDTERMLESLQRLRDSGATVVVVEHDGDVMRRADWLVDLGPGAGRDGGQLLFSGPVAVAVREAQTPTGEYLRSLEAAVRRDARGGEQEATACITQTVVESGPALTIRNARRHNLQNVTVQIPLQKLVCVTGVSGSGKSSLIRETLLPVARACLGDSGSFDHRSALSEGAGGEESPADRLMKACVAADCDGVEGLEAVRRVVSFEEAVVGSSPRSCVATLCGLWPEVKRLFAKTRDARVRGLKAADFSFNSAGAGRCPQCRGTGHLSVRMSLFPEAVVVCPSCRGRRMSPVIDAIRFRGLSAADVLQLRLDEAAGFFAGFARLESVLTTFCRLGLGYLALGQPATTFSGGERQRIRLACELAEPSFQPSLFILDEPTGGLHPLDVSRLLGHLRELVSLGHSVVVIEHQVDVMCGSDWLIDIGPESGGNGGRICGTGTPRELAGRGTTATAMALRSRFGL